MAAIVKIYERWGGGIASATGVKEEISALRYRSVDYVSGTVNGVVEPTLGPLTVPASDVPGDFFPENAFSFKKYLQLGVAAPAVGGISNIVAYTDIGGDGTDAQAWGPGVYVFFKTGTYELPTLATMSSMQLEGFDSAAFYYYDELNVLSIRTDPFTGVGVYQQNDAGFVPECLVSFMVVGSNAAGNADVPGRMIYFSWDET